MKLTFYGGAGEIGGNKILLESEGTRLFLDFGMSYSAEERFFEFPLLRPSCLDDLLKTGVLPRLPGLYRGMGLAAAYAGDGTPSVCGEAECRGFDAVLLSHAHMDHYGYVGRLRPDIPVHLSPVARRLIELRNEGEEWLTRIDMDSLFTMEKEDPCPVGNLAVRRFDVDHSVLGASAFLIHAGDTTIAYTGDFRFHGNSGADSEAFLQACKQEDVDVLLCEGTRAGPTSGEEEEVESHALKTEADVRDKCSEILGREKGLVVYDASPADMNRMAAVCRVAQEHGRVPVFDSRKAYLLLYLNHPKALCPGLPGRGEFKIALSRRRLDSRKYPKFGVPEEVFVETYTNYRQGHEAKLLVAQRDKQREGDQDLLRLDDNTFVWGSLREEVLKEPGRYLLYTSNGAQTLLHFLPPDGGKLPGTYIYGKAEPFKEEMELSFGRLKNWIQLCGLDMEYAHTSGHAHQAELERFVGELGAKVLIPIHTEHPEVFRQWGRDVRLPAPGGTIEV